MAMETSTSLPAEIDSSEPSENLKKQMETDGLITVSSFPRRRAVNKSSSLKARPRRQQSFSREIGHAAAETYLITSLSFKLLSYLGLPLDHTTSCPSSLRHVTYAWLSPSCISIFFSSQVRRSIIYGDQPRNRLDLYLPSNEDGLKPVVAFVTGGAWIIGYKAWGSLLGLQLAERDIIVACIDYRNFPQGTISDMVNDVCQGIDYICNNIIEYGGDPNKIYLMGQSAGAHISSCALVQQAIKESRGDSISWSVSQIKAYFGLSGAYNLLNLVDHFHNRGLYRSIFLSIMEGEKLLEQFSPAVIVQDPSSDKAVSLLPHIVLFHGTTDSSIPSDESYLTRNCPGAGLELSMPDLDGIPQKSKAFVNTLQMRGALADLILYDGKTHTDLFLQDPLRGGKDELFDYVVAFIHADDKEALSRDAMAPPRRRYVPEILLRLAHRVSPF